MLIQRGARIADNNRKLEIGKWNLENRNWKLVFEEEKQTQTNPMQLRDLISIEYEEEARNKPNGVGPQLYQYVAAISGLILQKYE